MEEAINIRYLGPLSETLWFWDPFQEPEALDPQAVLEFTIIPLPEE